MRYTKTFFLGLFLIFSCIVMTGCSDYVGKEKSHPLFVKAGASRAAGNYKESAQYYEDFLYVCPKSPLAHFELASVYADNLDEPFRAMYHYEKFLELAPDSPDAEDIRKFSAGCRKRVFDKLSKDYQSADAAKALGEVKRYREKLDEYINYSNKLRAQNEKMKEMIRSGRVHREVSVRPLRTTENVTTVEKPETENTAETVAEKPAPTLTAQPAASAGAVREYTVVSGDSLSKISRKMYGTTKHWRKIQEANPGRVGARGQVRVGVTLKIPAIGGR